MQGLSPLIKGIVTMYAEHVLKLNKETTETYEGNGLHKAYYMSMIKDIRKLRSAQKESLLVNFRKRRL